MTGIVGPQDPPRACKHSGSYAQSHLGVEPCAPDEDRCERKARIEHVAVVAVLDVWSEVPTLARRDDWMYRLARALAHLNGVYDRRQPDPLSAPASDVEDNAAYDHRLDQRFPPRKYAGAK